MADRKTWEKSSSERKGIASGPQILLTARRQGDSSAAVR